jgi:hypothetical protein
MKPDVAERTADALPGSSRARGSALIPRPVWGARAWWLEIAIIVLGYGVYELIQGIAPAGRGPAYAHAHQLARLEHTLHLNVELSINHFLNAHAVLATAAGYYYDGLHYLLTPAVLIWLWVYHRDVYGRWRSVLIIASLGALVVFWAWALAPPRLASPAIIDTLETRHIWGTVESPSTSKIVNDFAAMPSLHVGWALWCAAAVSTVSGRRLRHLAWLYPTATTLVVLGTGNHYVLDAVGGVLVVTVAWLVTRPRPSTPKLSGRAPSDAVQVGPAEMNPDQMPPLVPGGRPLPRRAPDGVA